MAKKKARKSQKEIKVPANLKTAVNYVQRIGELDQQAISVMQEAAAIIAQVKEAADKQVQEYEEQIEALVRGLYEFCKANRKELTNNEQTKTISWPTGEVSWRMTPKSVKIRNVVQVIQTLERRRLHRFLRIKKEVDKQALLQEEETAVKIPGISIEQFEQFQVKPTATLTEVTATIKSRTIKVKLNRPKPKQ